MMRWSLPMLVTAILATAWTALPAAAETLGPISEETPPAVCDPGWFVVEVACSGDYCDNVEIRCARVEGAALGAALWLPWISEEGRRISCPGNSLVAGLACDGKYCDSLSLYCVEVTNLNAVNCGDTAWVSEEQGRLYLGQGIVDKAGQQIAAKGIECRGDYCDDKRFEVCEVYAR